MLPSSSQIVVFASQKGGSGKTTLTGHMAVEAERRGAGPVALVDTDPQASLAGWWRARAGDTPAFIKATPAELPDVLTGLKQKGYALIMIDTPPAATASIDEVVGFADLVMIPTRPSPHDLRAVGATVDIVEARGKPMIFVVNSATARARITAEAAVALSQHGTVAPVTVHHRVDFAASMIDGRTVMEVNESGRSAQEIVNLWTYMEGRLARLVPSQPSQPGQPGEPASAPSATASSGPSFGISPGAPRGIYRHSPSFGRRFGVGT